MTKDSLQLDRRQLLAGAAAGSAAALVMTQNAAQAQGAPGKVTVFTDTSVQVTPDRMVDNVSLAIVDGKVAAMGPTAEILPKYPGADIYDGRGKAIMPGLINLHGHLAATIERGFNEDYGFPNSSKIPLPPSQVLTPEQNRLMVKIGMLEAIKGGTTTMVQLASNISAHADVLADSGCRMFFGEGVADSNVTGPMTPESFAKSVAPVYSAQKRDEGMQRVADLFAAWHGKDNGRIKVFPCAGLAETSSPELFKAVRAFAEKHDTPYESHLHQSTAEGNYFQKWHGMSPTEFLARADYLGPRFTAQHCRYLSDSDCVLLGKAGCTMGHQAPMASNRGVLPPIPQLRAAGATIALGTDNNTNDIFEVMRIAMVTERINRALQHLNPEEPLPGMRPQPEDMLEDCTKGGARAILMEKELGSLEIGKTADIIVIDTMRPHLQPYGRFLSVWIHNGQPSDTESVMVEGKFIMRQRKVLTMDEEAVTAEAAKVGAAAWVKSRAAGTVPIPGRGGIRGV